MVLIRVAVAAKQSKPHASGKKVENGAPPTVRGVTSANLWHIQPQRPRPYASARKDRAERARAPRGRADARL